MRWSKPIATPSEQLLAWQRHNARQLGDVETAWAAMLRRLRGHRPSLFDTQCRVLTSSLASVDESILLPVPDPLVDLYVRRLMRHLHGAATACGSGQLFNVVYRLEEARDALGEIRWLLQHRSVTPPDGAATDPGGDRAPPLRRD